MIDSIAINLDSVFVQLATSRILYSMYYPALNKLVVGIENSEELEIEMSLKEYEQFQACYNVTTQVDEINEPI